jgi:K+-transporting ATPase ATPase C chain
MVRDFLTSLRSVVMLWILTAILYPAIVLAIGQVFLPAQANGSLIVNPDGEIVGSALIGQTFSRDRYFWSRPSAIAYSEGEDAAPTGISGASNFAPSNPELLDRIEAEVQRLRQSGITPTSDLVYASGSGLDPHISPAAAIAQIDRVMQNRTLDRAQIRAAIADNTEGRFLEIFGEPGVNVLRLNLALDALESGA